MNFINSKLTLGAAAIAAALVFAPGSGMSTPLGAAALAPIGPQAGAEAAAGPVILAKDKGFACCGPGGGGGIPPGPGGLKPGGGKGGGGKGGGKGDHGHHHHHGTGAIIGGMILGLGYCAIQSERCSESYGPDTWRYSRCMRRAGC